MASQVRDRGNPPQGRIIRDMCVYKAVDDNGDQRLIINAPEPESRVVAEVVRDLFTTRPEDLSNDFLRSAMLIRVAIYLLVAASENALRDDMTNIGTKFNELYRQFRQELQKLMVFSFEMFDMFKTACYYYDGGNEELGAETLQDMQRKWTETKQTFTVLSKRIKSIETDAQKVVQKLHKRREKLGNLFDAYVACLSECTSGVLQIRSFLNEQKDLLENMQNAFNLEAHCARLQVRLNGTTFRRLTNDVTPGGFLYEIHCTILRCVAAKQISGSYTRALGAMKASFTQMVSATPSRTTAQQNSPGLIKEFNEAFPEYALNPGFVEKVQAANWNNPPPPQEQAWPCAIL